MAYNQHTLPKGVYSLLLTPYQSSGEIDYSAYERYVDWQLSHSPQALFAACGSSELLHLTADERVLLAAKAVAGAGQVLVVATGNAGSDPLKHKEEMLRMAETGVSAIVLIPPNGYGTDPQRLYAYFAEMVEASPLPILLYEYPGVAPHLIPADVYDRLANQHGVYGLKDTTCTMEGITAKIQAAPDSLILQANTPYLLQAIEAGANGIMAITSTAKANLNIRLFEHVMRRTSEDLQEAARLHRELVCLDALLSNGFTSTAKYLVNLQGIPFSTATRSGAAVSASAAKALAVWHDSLPSEWK